METELLSPAERWPEADLERVEACPVCGKRDRSRLHADLRDRVFRCAPGAWSLCRCDGCGSAYLDPRPTPASIGRAYATYHTHQAVSTATQTPPDLRRRSKPLRSALRSDYLNARYGYCFRTALPLGRLLLSPRQRCEADRWIRHLHLQDGSPRLLDLGCGNGEFVARMREAGWEAEGLEVDAQAVRFAREAGLAVRHEALTEDTFPPERFDAITLSHVIEHLHDPAETLRICRRILCPGGVLWIATPNLGALGRERYGADWLGLDPPRHLVLFTPESLRGLLERLGFTTVGGPFANQSAKWSFRASTAIALGSAEPLNRRALQRLSRTLDNKVKREAARADRESLRRPERAEELILLAQKPA